MNRLKLVYTFDLFVTQISHVLYTETKEDAISPSPNQYSLKRKES